MEEVIDQFDTLSPNYRLIVERKGTMDTVMVEVESSGDIPSTEQQALSKQLAGKIKNTIGLSMATEVKQPNTIPRSQGGKLSRIVDKR